MKKFITKILVFTSIFSLFILLTIFLVKYHSNFKIAENKTMLVVGHSGSECAFNDSLIRGLSNFSFAGESYFYTFFKTKKLLEQNSQINTIFIEYTNNQIEKVMDDWIWSEKFMSFEFPKYALFMDNEAYDLLYEKNPKCLKECIAPTLKNIFNILSKGLKYTGDIGGYRYLVRDKTESILKELPIERENDPSELSYKNIEYLLKLIQYCKQRKLKVYLVRTPLHEKYYGFDNEQIYQELLSTKLSDVEFLDFAKFPLQNSEFGDLEHLNFRGAKIFSIWFNKLVQEGNLEEYSKQPSVN